MVKMSLREFFEALDKGIDPFALFEFPNEEKDKVFSLLKGIMDAEDTKVAFDTATSLLQEAVKHARSPLKEKVNFYADAVHIATIIVRMKYNDDEIAQYGRAMGYI